MEYIGTRENGLIHVAEYPVEKVLAGHFRTKIKVGLDTYSVHHGSLRYLTFDKSCVCCCCGIVGSRMFLDAQNVGCGSAHFNLYAEWDGKLVLMTRDHIVPRSKGGKDVVENMRTMCTVCNGHRGDLDIPLDELYELVIVKERERLARDKRAVSSSPCPAMKRPWPYSGGRKRSWTP